MPTEPPIHPRGGDRSSRRRRSVILGCRHFASEMRRADRHSQLLKDRFDLGAVPMLLPRWCKDYVARLHTGNLSAGPNATGAVCDVDDLTPFVGVPVGTAAGLEHHGDSADSRLRLVKKDIAPGPASADVVPQFTLSPRACICDYHRDALASSNWTPVLPLNSRAHSPHVPSNDATG